MLLLLLLLCAFIHASDSELLIPSQQPPTYEERMAQRNQQRRERTELIAQLHPESTECADRYWRCYDRTLTNRLFPEGNPAWDGPAAECVPKYYARMRRAGCGCEHVQWCCGAVSCCCGVGMLTYGAVQASTWYMVCGALQLLCFPLNVWQAKKGVEQTKQFDVDISSAGHSTISILPTAQELEEMRASIRPSPPSDEDDNINRTLLLSLKESGNDMIAPPTSQELATLHQLKDVLLRLSASVLPEPSSSTVITTCLFEPPDEALSEQDKLLLLAIRAQAAHEDILLEDV